MTRTMHKPEQTDIICSSIELKFHVVSTCFGLWVLCFGMHAKCAALSAAVGIQQLKSIQFGTVSIAQKSNKLLGSDWVFSFIALSIPCHKLLMWIHLFQLNADDVAQTLKKNEKRNEKICFEKDVVASISIIVCIH